MKKLLSILLALLLLVPGASVAEDPVFDAMWAASDWSFLADWGVLTAEEAARLSADRAAVEAGREVVRTVRIETGALNGDPHMDQLLAEFMTRVTIVNRSRADGEAVSILLDGEDWLSFALAAQEGGYVLDTSLAPAAVQFTAEELAQPGTLVRLIGAMQSGGLITRDDAMMVNMMLLGGGMPWPMSMLGKDLSGVADFETTAWDAAVEAILGRREYERIPGGGTDPDAQPEGCDPAAQVWTLYVTQDDVRDLAVAGLTDIRDNPALGEQLAALMDYSSVNAAGSNVSFNDAFINPLIEELTAAEMSPFFTIGLRGYEDGTGTLVRLEAEVVDSSGDELAPVFFCLYNRLSAEGAVTHEVLFGDDMLEAYVICTVTEPHGTYARGYEVTVGDIDPEGARTEVLRVVLGAATNRSIPGMTEALALLSVIVPANAEWGDVEESRQDLLLNVAIAENDVSIGLAFQYSEGDRLLTDMQCGMDYATDGVDLTGTERFSVSVEGERLLSLISEVHTCAPQGSLCSHEAVSLSGMSNAELNDWVAQAKASWDALTGEVFDWVMREAAELPVTGEIVVTNGAGGKTWRIGVVEGDEVICVGESADVPGAGVALEHADGTGTYIAFTGLQEGRATVRMLTLVVTDDGEVVTEVNYYDVQVDAEGNVRVPEHRQVKKVDGQ
ncbi:MAG: hypothetical protein IJE07_11070 [Clostridia bacterium]|nr:hypothetical protein [Clostridia bacterium]